ncbi:MAG: FG-GAP-like repeat-containing protein [Bryobacteraceae bacterium]
MIRLLFLCASLTLLLAQAWQQEAALLFQQQKYAESAALLQRKLRDHPTDFAAHMLLGLCRQQLKQYGEAEASFTEAARLQPANARARYALARVRFFQGRFNDALATAAEAYGLGEPAARIYHLRGRIEEERGSFAAALEAYRSAVQADRAMVEALSGEASVLYKLARYAEARASAKAALLLEPTNVEAKRILEQANRPAITVANEGAQPVRFLQKHAIDFQLNHFPTDAKHLISTMAGGLAVFDFDNDGRSDLFFCNGAEIPSLKKTGPRFWNRLYRNKGDWQFQDVTESQGLQGAGFSMGAAVADFDNDGRVDLFVSGVGRNLLYRNTPNGFVDISDKAGIYNDSWSIAAAWLDYDRDGWADLFVVNYVDWKPESEPYCGDKEKALRVYCHPREYKGLPNRLYRNRGNGTFEDVSEAAGIARHAGKGMSAVVIDADGDGWPDLFVTNDMQPNFLFHNRKDGRFEEAGAHYGVALNEQGSAISSMGVDARDYDNDGLPDLIVTGLTGENFPLFRNTGKESFEDVTFRSRLGPRAARRSGWGAVFADLNNDGWKDLFTANAHVTDNVERFRSERYREPNAIFLNRNGAFVATQEIGPNAAHRGLAIADLDNDGRLDAVVTVLGEKPELWKNETEAGNWLRLNLEGRSLGARVRIGDQWQERSSAAGYASSSLGPIHFGLGLETEADIEIFWPGGKKQAINNVKAGQTLTVREPDRP